MNIGTHRILEGLRKAIHLENKHVYNTYVSTGKAMQYETTLRFVVWTEEQPKPIKRVLKMVMV